MTNLIHSELSQKILHFAFTVHNILGPGLLESCYEGALVVELQQAGIPHQRQQVFPLFYKGERVGDYIADLVVDNTIILELKSVRCFNPVMEAQLLGYLRISGCPLGFLMNFNALSVQWKRFVCQRE
jgi:GxxExxY protein